MEQPGVVAANLGLRFSLHFLSIFVHISGSIRPITLIWALLERSPSPSEVEHRWCQFWSKVMTSEVEERPREGRHGPLWRLGSQWVNKKAKNPNFAEFLAFWGLFGIGLTNLSQKDPSFGKLGHVIKQRQGLIKEAAWPSCQRVGLVIQRSSPALTTTWICFSVTPSSNPRPRL